ncbi:MAG: leucine-rich repeat protein [Clostridia bacterium]|nr:leucine-rich repeat protein [Clostridia bacterium]
MKIRHTKLLCVMLSVFLLLGMLPAATAFAATSGTWGSGTHKISYAYADGILTISGNGDEITSPSNYTGSGSYLPWQNQSYTNSIEEVVFDAPNLAKIGGNAFKNLYGLKRITIPDTVTTIGWYAFQGCSALEDLYWPSSITAVDVYIFKDANVKRMHIDSLESIYSVGHLGAYNSALMDRVIDTNPWGHAEAIYINDEKVTDFTPPQDMTVIPSLVFCGAPFETVTLPEYVTAIDTYAFFGCKQLQSVQFAENSAVTSIGASAFRKSGLPSFTFADSVETVGEYAFAECTDLASVTFGEGLTTLSDHMFYKDTALADLYVKPTLTTVSEYATQYMSVGEEFGDVWYYGTKAMRDELMTFASYNNIRSYDWHFLQDFTVSHYYEDFTGAGTYLAPETESRSAFSGVTVLAEDYKRTVPGLTFTGAIPESIVLPDAYGSDEEAMLMDLYYARSKYAVAFYAENGEDLLSSGEFYYGETPVYSGELPAKAEDAAATYTLYWREMADGAEGNRYLPAELPETTAAVNYRAEFAATPKTYAVTVSAAEGVTLTETPASPAPYGEAAVKFTVDDGYDASALTVTVDGVAADPTLTDGVYTVALFVEAETTVSIGFVQLDFTLTVKNGYDDNDLTYTGRAGESVTVASPTREGYAFTGWTGDTDGLSGTAYTFGSADAEITATWYDTSDANAAITAAGTVTGSGDYETAYTETLAGYVTALENTLAAVPADASVIASALSTLQTALEEAEDHRVQTWSLTLVLAGGTYRGSTDDVVIPFRADDAAITLPTDVTRDGCTLLGWYTADDVKVSAVTPADCTADVVLTAKWQISDAVINKALNDANALIADAGDAYCDSLADALRPLAADLAAQRALDPRDDAVIGELVDAINALVADKDSYKHDWGPWEVIVPATYEADGYEERVCRRGGEVQRRTLTVSETADRPIKFNNISKMYYIIDVRDGYDLYRSETFMWYSAADLRFRVYTYTNFAYDSYEVYVNGVAVQADENGYYTVPAGSGLATVSILPASVNQNSGSKTNLWEWLIRLLNSFIDMFRSIFQQVTA